MNAQQPVNIVMIEDDEGHARLIEKNIRRAGSKCPTAALGGIVCCADEYGQPCPGWKLIPDEVDYRNAVHLWHDEIGNHHIGLELHEIRAESARMIQGPDVGEPEPLQHRLEEAQSCHIVIQDEDACLFQDILGHDGSPGLVGNLRAHQKGWRGRTRGGIQIRDSLADTLGDGDSSVFCRGKRTRSIGVDPDSDG